MMLKDHWLPCSHVPYSGAQGSNILRGYLNQSPVPGDTPLVKITVLDQNAQKHRIINFVGLVLSSPIGHD